MALLSMTTMAAHAQPSSPASGAEGRWAVGFQRFTWNAWGPSVMVRAVDRVDVQLLYGLLYQRSGEKDLMARVRVRVAERGRAELFVYGGGGRMWLEEWGAEETGRVLAGGAGLAYHASFLPGLSLEGEVGGETVRGFEVIDGNYDSAVLSVGVHFRF